MNQTDRTRPAWPRCFFGPGNDLRLEGPGADEAAAWLTDLDRSDRALFLPRRREGRTTWYALARTVQQGRELREQLLGFLGPSYTDFTGLATPLAPGDPCEAALVEVFAVVYRLAVPQPADEPRVRELLHRLRSLLARRPGRLRALPVSLGRLLRDFELALRGRDWTLATDLWQTLCGRAELAADRLGGLKVRLLAEQGRWDELLTLPELPDLLNRPRPATVTEALLRAVYQRHLARFEATADAAGAVAAYRTELAGTYGALFRGGNEGRSPDVLAALLVSRVAAPEPSTSAIEALTRGYPGDGPAIAFVRALADLARPVSPPVTGLELARRAMEANDFETALVILLTASATVEALGLLLQCAAELDRLDLARQAAARFEAATEDVRQGVLARRTYRLLWEQLRQRCEEAAPGVPNDWPGWLERLDQGEWPGAIEAARAGGREWSLAALRVDPALLRRFCQNLGREREPEPTEILRNSLPHLLEAFLPEGRIESVFAPIYWQLLELTVFDNRLGPAAAPAIRELTGAVLESGLDGTQAAALLGLLELAWEQLQQPRLFDWGLDLLDLLADRGIGERQDVTPLLRQMITAFARHFGRVREEQWAVLEYLCLDLGHPDLYSRPARRVEAEEVAAANEEQRFREQLDGRTIVLHTLSGRIGAVVKGVIERRFPAARFKLNDDRDASPQLRDLARSADVFIVNTWDAKHAATTFIKRERPEDRVTLYPGGKNAAQQLESLFDWLRSV